MKTAYDKNGNKVIFTEEKDLDPIKIFINPIGNSVSADANKYIHTGIYRIFDIDKNTPITNPNGILIAFNYQSDVTSQLFINFDGQTYTRILWYGTWNNWSKLSV